MGFFTFYKMVRGKGLELFQSHFYAFTFFKYTLVIYKTAVIS